MRNLLSAVLILSIAPLQSTVLAQTRDTANAPTRPPLMVPRTAAPEAILAQAEYVYPEAKAPTLYASGSASAPYSSELEDEIWAPVVEARIESLVRQERDEGLVLRRADIECRTTTCAVLLIHPVERSDGSVGELIEALRESLRFVGISVTSTEIPMMERLDDGRTQTWFFNGYVEILLTGGLKTPEMVNQLVR